VNKKYTLFSLFSGAGGLDLGFKLSNMFDVVFANDISGPATETHSMNFHIKHVKDHPSIADLPVVFQGDVAELKVDAFEKLEPDVIAGGPPCQDFSMVRGPGTERAGTKVSRGRLYSHFVRALIHLQPRVFVFENVPGLVNANEGVAYQQILEDFSKLSIRWDEIRQLVGNSSQVKPKAYEIVYNDLTDAKKLGVPQARRRLIIVGLRKDISASIWWKIDGLKRRVADIMKGKGKLTSKYPLTTMEIFEGRPLPELGNKYAELMKEYRGVAEEVGTQKAMQWKKDVWEKLTFDAVQDYVAINKIEVLDKDETGRAFAEHSELLKELGYYGTKVFDVACSNGSNETRRESEGVLERMKRIPPDENHEFVRNTTWEVEGKGMSLIYRRIHPLKPAYTVVAYGGGGTWGYHYERQRATLNNRERARLQTFPDWFTFSGNRSQVRAQIGEAVPPLMAKTVARCISEILEDTN